MRKLRLVIVALVGTACWAGALSAGEKYGWKGAAKGDWPTKMHQVALPKDKLPKVVKTHPRLYVRAKPWKYGPSVAELRARAKKEPWAGRFNKPPKGGTELALYYLATGDESVVPRIVEGVINRKIPSRYGKFGSVPIDPAIFMYDWVCTSKNVTTEQKKAMQAVLIKIAEKTAKQQDMDFMHHWGAGTCPTNVLAVGLALYGDHPDGEKFLSWGLGFYRATYLPAYKHCGGIWQGGGKAYYGGRAQTIPRGIYMWASGTHEDIFEIIKKEYGNWFEDMMYYFMHQTLPDCTRVDTTGFDYAPEYPFPWTRNFMIFAAGNRSPEPYAFMRWAMKKKYYKMRPPEDDFLFYDERIEKIAGTAKFPKGIFGAKVWGREGVGYVQFRKGGWAPDATVIEFKCGDHIWSHNISANQNSFYIFHKGRLAIQSGIYHDKVYFGNHTRQYYARTVSSNGMLVIDPQEFSWVRKSGVVKSSGPDGCYPEYGSQRMIRGSCNAFTFKEYMARKVADPSIVKGKAVQHWEMGDITAFAHAAEDRWSYVSGDATQAYNNPKRLYRVNGGKSNRAKLDLATRSMVYLPAGNNLIVYDKVNSLDPSFRKAWLLHAQDKLEVSGKVIKAEVPGHIEEYDGDTVTLTWGNSGLPASDPKDPHKGRLLVKTFLPAERYIRRIGGAGYEFWANGANHPPTTRGRDQKHTKPDDGNWRVEVSPAKPAKFNNFLHLIHICDTRTKKVPASSLVASEDGSMTGLAVGGWAVMFGTKGEVKGPVSYKAPAGATRHLVVDLVRGAKYKVSGLTGGDRKMSASKEGVLHFKTAAGAAVKLTPAD